MINASNDAKKGSIASIISSCALMMRQFIRSLLHHRCRSFGCVGLVTTAEQCLHGGWPGALVGIGVWCLFRAVCIVQGTRCMQSKALNYMPSVMCSPMGIRLFYPIQSSSIRPNPAKRATKNVSKNQKVPIFFAIFLS